MQAKELTNKDIIGKSDPYAVLYVRPLRDRMKKSRTIVKKLICFCYIFLHNPCMEIIACGWAQTYMLITYGMIPHKQLIK